MPELITKPLVLPLVKHPEVNQDLYPHQAVMLDEWDNHNSFMLVTKTGTGKTIGAILPILKKKLRAICVYPTNELISDQIRNITNVAIRENLKVCTFSPETSAEDYGASDLVLVHIDANLLEKWCRKRHWKQKWRVLSYLLETDKQKIILTNPDILFLIFALKYHAEVLAELQGYNALIIDEFHLYSGIEFAHALFMLHMGRSLGTFPKVVLLTATPAPGSEELIKSVLNNPLQIDASIESQREVIGQRQAVKSVRVLPRFIGEDVVETVVNLVKELNKDIFERRKDELDSKYIPVVIILNSVINAIRLEDRLADEGFDRKKDMAIIRGLSARSVRSTACRLIAIGTSAIEVGIDFECDFLIFEAGDAASFMQRFGRVGRHNPGIAYVLCPLNVVMGIENLVKDTGGIVDRGQFEERIHSWYPSPETRAWFSKKFMGLLSAFTLGERLIGKVQDDLKSSSEQIALIESEIESFYYSYCEKIDCSERILKKTLSYLRKARRGENDYQWVRSYRDLNTFRTSLPSEWVLDFAEKNRRGGNWDEAKYKVDVNTLLHRAKGLEFNDKIPHPEGNMGILTVQGYGKYNKVQVIPTFDDQQFPSISCTSENHDLTFLINDGHKPIPARVSRVMTFRDHIFTIVPRSILPELDWRLPVFECGRNIIGFDGVALLLYEIYNQELKSSG